MDNKVYEFGGLVDILIKCKTPMEIAGKNYAANEPYTLLRDVGIAFTYADSNKTGVGDKTVFTERSGRPDTIMIYNVPFNSKILNLAFTTKDNHYIATKSNIISCWETGILYVDTAIAGQVWCYDNNNNLLETTIVDAAAGKISGNFVVDETYKVFFDADYIGTKYSLEVPYYPYFELEIFGRGNVDKSTSEMYMHFYAASFISTPQFTPRNGIFDLPLQFKFIYTGQEEPIIGV